MFDPCIDLTGLQRSGVTGLRGLFKGGGGVDIRVNDEWQYWSLFLDIERIEERGSVVSIAFKFSCGYVDCSDCTGKKGWSGLIPHVVDGGVSILQYADDTILFLEHDLAKAVNMKLILSLFDQLSGLKINFHKKRYFLFWKGDNPQV